ncbi:hypothetical protein C3747_144g93 [Trypanosoma cruzi]|uniref:Uncharacterized protein n=2 Tax=Trypanosoma cruzi TaxID=5693 RepID=Q4CPT1_TRYCC|nr:hypothetical protein, conserved [Trypanosoma cruzi]EAN82284.1 hypothetical protein, conserved [Trypanosoma cruzi]PWV04778.1 hypothetical protein C3747_144g93 [Trypanosoma cruzi]RNC46365.1 hypothetical protein TcCL_NonESM03825 [Trypanosoma cruzi]|eukprot:XP_804135.1 hypothetical protein [Trypanosoma cruzi strain CL Brener]
MKGTFFLRRQILSGALSKTEVGKKIIQGGFQLHPYFDVHHELGSREFILYSNNIHDASVLVHCLVGSSPLRSLDGGCKKDTGKKKLLPKARCQNCTVNVPPVEFSVFVYVFGSGITVEISCSSMLGFLIIDGVTTHDGLITDSLVPREGYPIGEMLYQGPWLNQRALSESVLSVRSNVNPLDPWRQEQAFFFNRHVRPWISRFLRFGHSPVHTVKPEFADALFCFLECFYVDDDLAAFVERFAHEVQRKEREMWSKIVMDIIR